MAQVRHLLLSNSKNAGSTYLAHAVEPLERLMGVGRKRIAFLPYAAVRFSFDKYESAVADAFPGHDIVSVHRSDSPKVLLSEADAIAVGGGNTFCLLDAIFRFDLIRVVRERVAAGVPYIGWSAEVTLHVLPSEQPTICRSLSRRLSRRSTCFRFRSIRTIWMLTRMVTWAKLERNESRSSGASIPG